MDNAQIAELLALAAEGEEGHRRRALERAARAAMFWPEEAAALPAAGRSLTELPAVGPWMATRIERLLQDQPDPPDTPEVRRGFLTLARVRTTLAGSPDWTAELQGDLQMHTTFSDGSASLPEMVAAAEALGRRFVAVTDHSKTLKIAHGMDEVTLARQAEEVRGLREELEAAPEEVHLLHGIEMDLTPLGEGDMDPADLGRLDIVLGAFHSSLRLEEDQTERYLAAVRNPTVHVLAHPTTRRFNRRLGLRADWRRVFEEAAERGTAVEIDASPARQDLPVELLRIALETEVRFTLGSDAHSPTELGFLEFGLAAAILAGIPKERIWNFRPVEEVLAWTAARRAGSK